MIREMDIKDREDIDRMQFELQKYFSEIDRTHESLPYKDMDDAHRYMQKMLDDVKNMNGKVFVSEEDGQVVGFIQGVIIEHRKGDDEIYDLSHKPSKDGWIGLLFVKPEFRGSGVGRELLDKMKEYFESEECTSIRLLVLSDNIRTVNVYEKSGFLRHDLEMVLKV